MSRAITDLLPEVQVLAQKLLDAAAAHGFPVKLTQTFRTFEEQDELYAKGRTTPGQIVTQAVGGLSWHNYRRAFDVVFVVDGGGIDWHGPWRSLGQIGQGLGLEWGGAWKHPDIDHFEYHPNLTLTEALAAWKEQQHQPAGNDPAPETTA